MTKATEAKWRGLIGEQEGSGLTVREFARRRGINAGTLFWWRCRLRRRRHNETALVPVEVVDAQQVGHGGAMELQVRGDIVLRLPPGFEEADLRRVLAVLDARC